jgi:uncharacterized protein (UPF0128 family)
VDTIAKIKNHQFGECKAKNEKKKEETFNRKNLKFWNFDVQFGAIVGQSFGDSVIK